MPTAFVNAVDGGEPCAARALVQLAPESEGASTAVATEALARVGVEEFHMEAGFRILRRLDQDQAIAPDAEVAVAEVTHQFKVACRERSGSVINEDEVVAGAVPFGEGEGHGGKDGVRYPSC